MANVFICYHDASARKLAQQIAEKLEQANISCWYAKRDMPPGGNFAKEIPLQIDACKLFLLLLNNDIYQSPFVEGEVGLAFERYRKGDKIQILSLEIGNFQRKDWVSLYLIHQQSLSLSAPPNAQEMKRVVEHVARLLNQLLPIGSCGKNLTYTLDENGRLVISGNGPMRNYVLGNAPWYPQRNNIVDARIENGVTSIGEKAFLDCENLKSVSIPEGVTSIKGSAFYGCRSLESVEIPKSVQSIGTAAFYSCKGLQTVRVDYSATSIGQFAFKDCVELTQVVDLDNVTSIKMAAFDGCRNLKKISVPSKAKIDFSAFDYNFTIVTFHK